MPAYEQLPSGSGSSGDLLNFDSRPKREWKSGSWSQFARTVGSLTAVCVLSVGAFLIIHFSDGDPTNSWPWQEKKMTFFRRFITPTVSVAAIAALSNILLRYAFDQAMSVCWWKESLTEQSVSDLHDNWKLGHSTWSAFASRVRCTKAKSGRFHLLSWTNILVSMAVLQGTLFQRASSVVLQNTEVMGVSAAVHVPPRELSVSQLTKPRNSQTRAKINYPRFLPIHLDFHHKRPIEVTYTGCDASCFATVVAPGFDFSCTSYEKDFDVTVPENEVDLFRVAFAPFAKPNNTQDGGLDKILFNTVAKSTPGCFGKVVGTNCTAHSAIVRYNVTLSNQTATLAPLTDLTQNDTVRLVYGDYSSYTPINETHNLFNISDVQALQVIMQLERDSSLSFSNSTWYPHGQGSLLFAIMEGVSTSILSGQAPDPCNITYTDPSLGIGNDLRELMFRAAVKDYDESNKDDLQTVDVRSGIFTVYQSERIFVVIGVMFPLFAAIFVFSLMSGWRELGRDVSLSPVEIAKAFGALVLEEAGSNEEVEKLLKQVKSRRTKYGETMGGRLGFGETDVKSPRHGKMYA